MSAIIDDWYISLEEARDVLHERKALIPQVEAWWKEEGWKIPHIIHTGDAGFFARQLASFRYEDLVFQQMCHKAGLTPVWLPYEADRFSDQSSLKRSYVRPLFCTGRGKNGGLQTRKRRLVPDMQAILGKRLNEIIIHDGTSLVDFHRQLHSRHSGGAVQEVSGILTQIGNPRAYYRFDMSLYIAHGILFEDFHGGESGQKLNRFTTQIFEPAFQEVARIFGVKPLIVQMPWCKELGYYPENSSSEALSVVDLSMFGR